jgi:uncharacterized RDD family membrane protein YckC
MEIASSLMTGGVANLVGNMMPMKGRSNFSDTGAMVGVVLVVVLIMLSVWVLVTIAVYRLTGSGIHAILFFLFGSLYLTIAIIYYGFTGHRFCKVKA